MNTPELISIRSFLFASLLSRLMSGKVHFQFADGTMKGKAFVFDEHDTFIFGRAADCHATLAGR